VIVVDTNLVAYAVLPGARTAAALALAEREPVWVAPGLWRHEMRNVLVTLMRVRGLALDGALAVLAAAESLVADAEVEPSNEQRLRMAARGGVSAYDAEFVCVAEALGVPLVSADRRLARAFPGHVLSLEEAAGV
jgi:predicted nucleic acid-binding protein